MLLFDVFSSEGVEGCVICLGFLLLLVTVSILTGSCAINIFTGSSGTFSLN